MASVWHSLRRPLNAIADDRRQFAAVLSPRKRLEVARKIVGVKLRTLGLTPGEARGFRGEIGEARKVEDLLVAEMRAGAVYFTRWRAWK